MSNAIKQAVNVKMIKSAEDNCTGMSVEKVLEVAANNPGRGDKGNGERSYMTRKEIAHIASYDSEGGHCD